MNTNFCLQLRTEIDPISCDKVKGLNTEGTCMCLLREFCSTFTCIPKCFHRTVSFHTSPKWENNKFISIAYNLSMIVQYYNHAVRDGFRELILRQIKVLAALIIWELLCLYSINSKKPCFIFSLCIIVILLSFFVYKPWVTYKYMFHSILKDL